VKISDSFEDSGTLRSEVVLQPDSLPLQGCHPSLQGREQPFVTCPWLLFTSLYSERMVDSKVVIREETAFNDDVTVVNPESSKVIRESSKVIRDDTSSIREETSSIREETNSIVDETVSRTLERALISCWVTKEGPAVPEAPISAAPTAEIEAGTSPISVVSSARLVSSVRPPAGGNDASSTSPISVVSSIWPPSGGGNASSWAAPVASVSSSRAERSKGDDVKAESSSSSRSGSKPPEDRGFGRVAVGPDDRVLRRVPEVARGRAVRWGGTPVDEDAAPGRAGLAVAPGRVGGPVGLGREPAEGSIISRHGT
jgi:hypothetical protein